MAGQFSSRMASYFKLLAQQGLMTRARAISMTLAVTLLNPHVYLDTVMIQGRYPGNIRVCSNLVLRWGASRLHSSGSLV